MTVLDRIFARKREEVEEAQSLISISDVRLLANEAAPPLGFRKALAESSRNPSLIAEVKKASPSKGVIRPDFDPVDVACAYQEAGAQCLSVLTDRDYFQGDPDYLRRVKAATGLPCLRKDFIYDAYQVYEARAWGADCILLIVASLSKAQIADLGGLARELGMDTLVEVHDEREAELAIELGCDFVGVNNRNLKDFQTSLETSGRLMPMLAEGLPGVALVSESALRNYEDIVKVSTFGARAVLIGTTFCASPDIASKVREVMGW